MKGAFLKGIAGFKPKPGKHILYLIRTSLFLISAVACLTQVQIPTDLPQSGLSSPRWTLPNLDADVSHSQSERQKAAEQIKTQEKQRILGLMPQFNVSNISGAARLDSQQKFELAVKSALDRFTFVAAGLTSAMSQAQNSFPGYGQGAEGYAKRFGASYADSFDGMILGNGVLPVLLHQDPRYFRKGTGSFASRLGYAVMTTFVCKGDNGRWEPNVSNVLGNFAAGGISNLYYPAGDRGFVDTYQHAIVVTGEGTLGAILSEFWPDIARHFRKHPGK